MNLMTYEPWSLVNRLHRDLDALVNRDHAGNDGGAASVADWIPAVDIAEAGDKFVLRADVPGVDPADIELSMEDGVLTLSGQRRFESSEEENGMRRIERRSGKFYRRFSLPDTADAESISARSQNGVLEVTIPKQPKVQPRRITVENS